MSLDLSIDSPPCEQCGRGEDTLEFNYTYNVSPMWYEIYPEDDGMVFIDGMSGKEAYPKVSKAISEMLSKEKFMKKLNPENGWGDYEGFLEFLHKVADACIKCPNGIWESYR